MHTARPKDSDYEAKLKWAADSAGLFDPVIEEQTREIILGVKNRGDNALLEFTRRFDGASLTREQLRLSTAELLEASLQVAKPLRSAAAEAHKNIAAFARLSLRKAWSTRNSHGARVGEKFDPFQRVGIYIPGGTAPLISTALMTITLARTAGCPEIVVCTPCGSDGQVNPGLLFAARMAGATEIYRAGGSQAIAAMALGTTTIPKVQKIFGPGNAYVVAAKRLLFGHVAVDLLPGPSEVLVLADDTADPALVAADLLAQAEHGSGHERVWMVTTSARLLQDVDREIDRQAAGLSRREFIEKSLSSHGWLIQARNLDHAIQLTNSLAPEHCEIMTRKPAAVARRILTAGAIFLGPWSPTVLGDYVAGPSHTLPTGGAGASFAGLTVDQFQRRTSLVEYSKASLRKALPAVETFAQLEGLDAHGASARQRLPARTR